MIALLFSAPLLSLDSLIVAGALSPLVEASTRRWQLAILFGVCDGLAVLFGSILNSSTHFVTTVVPFLILTYGVYCLVAAYWNKFRANPRIAYILPVLMSFDNLTYGVGSGPLAHGVFIHSMVFGFTSFVLAKVGFLIGDVIRFPNVRTAERMAGFALIIVCFALLFM